MFRPQAGWLPILPSSGVYATNPTSTPTLSIACSPSLLTCCGDHVEQHFNLAGEEGPATVGVLPAYKVRPVIQHDLAHSALWDAKVGLTPYGREMPIILVQILEEVLLADNTTQQTQIGPPQQTPLLQLLHYNC